MRDPQRINKFLELINQLWTKNPDLRFNQLIYILQNGYSQINSGVGEVESAENDGFKQTGFDLFNVEDDDFLEYLKSKVQNSEW
ncbi:DUF1040 family protein [Shewanella gelidii]|uniref:Uncharacterized protein n=1 Tax=Shewanella gelidii TaxID=1642821 RepID=A0A917NEP0_9GAMM|nr:DUF1040 family protein [Shewanella gelidii]MCL1098540.1 DUF1040 family protein [Shewanella gelidii]GGI93419.1 hypothetical protein GCM10009332_33360 [Shewanella gelidii]